MPSNPVSPETKNAVAVIAYVEKHAAEFSMASWKHCLYGALVKTRKWKFNPEHTPAYMERQFAKTLGLDNDVAAAVISPKPADMRVLKYVPAAYAIDALKMALGGAHAGAVRQYWRKVLGV